MHLTDLQGARGARLVNFNRGQFNEMPSSTMYVSTENRFCGIVRDDALEIVNYLLRGVVTHRVRTLSVIHAILNTTLCDDKNEMFHSGEKLMFLGQNVKNYLFKKSVQ